MGNLKTYCFFIAAAPRNMSIIKELVEVESDNLTNARIAAIRKFDYDRIISVKNITK